MPNEVSLLEMLDARERRVEHQQALLAQYHKPLICFTMNIAGKFIKSKVYMVCVSEVFIGFMALDFIGICRLVTFFFGNVCKKALRRALFC